LLAGSVIIINHDFTHHCLFRGRAILLLESKSTAVCRTTLDKIDTG
jgi:hypothetical protein